MIEVLSFNKAAEGLLYKSSQIRYVWSIKVNDIRHIIELIVGSFGKKQLLLDQKELYNSRSVLSSDFSYKFLVDNCILIIRNKDEEFDIYPEEDESTSFRTMLMLKNHPNVSKPVQKETFSYQSSLPGIEDNSYKRPNNNFARTDNRQNNDGVDFLGLEGNSDSTTKRNFNNFDFNKVTVNNPVSKIPNTGFGDINNTTNNQQKDNNPFADKKEDNNWSFKEGQFGEQPKKRDFKIFDSVPNKPQKNDFFEEVDDSFKNAKLIQDNNNGFVIKHDKTPEMSNFINADTFDQELEKDQKRNKKFIKSPFDMDPEESVEAITNSLKSVFKRTQKTLNKIEWVNKEEGKRLFLQRKEIS